MQAKDVLRFWPDIYLHNRVYCQFLSDAAMHSCSEPSFFAKKTCFWTIFVKIFLLRTLRTTALYMLIGIYDRGGRASPVGPIGRPTWPRSLKISYKSLKEYAQMVRVRPWLYFEIPDRRSLWGLTHAFQKFGTDHRKFSTQKRTYLPSTFPPFLDEISSWSPQHVISTWWMIEIFDHTTSETNCHHHNNNKKSQNNLGRAASPPLTQRMDSSAACASSCAMSTVDESSSVRSLCRYTVRSGNPQPEAANIYGGGIRQRNVGQTYRKNVALQCGCSVPAAEWLDSSTVGIAQVVVHAAEDSILCVRCGDAALPKLLWDFLFSSNRLLKHRLLLQINRLTYWLLRQCWQLP